jgi:uncharacterized paraquat-inducible protein A
MPARDGTGPMGQGPPGRGMNRRPLRPGDECVCPNCGYRTAHIRGKPCNQRVCPKCGSVMTRDEFIKKA